MGKLVFVSFRHEMSSNCTRTMPQIHPELSKSLKFSSFCCNFCTISERFRSKFQHNQLNNKRTSFVSHFLKRKWQRFFQRHFRMTPKESKYFNTFVFEQLVNFLNSFGSRMLANVQQRPTS